MDDYLLKLLGTGTVVATAAAWYLLSKPPVFNPNFDFSNQVQNVLKMGGTSASKYHPLEVYEQQSINVPGSERAKITRLAEEGKPVSFLKEDCQTLHEAYKRGARVSNNGASLGWKPSPTEPYKWISFNDVLTKASYIGSGFISLGHAAANSTHIGIYSQNRPEYFIVEQGCYMYSMAIVPLYDTLGKEACSFIINQAELKLIVCDKNEKVKNLLTRFKETPILKTLIVMETISEENLKLAQQVNVKLMQYSELEAVGERSPQAQKLCKPDDIAVICYTSGTTGMPKGAMLTHRNTLCPVEACVYLFEKSGLMVYPSDTLISYLPLAHSYERLCEGVTYYNGAKIGFFQGDVKTLMDDIQELKPTVFPSVPRLLNRVYDKVMAGVSTSALKSKLLHMGLSSKEKEIQGGIVRNNSLWDKLVFSKLQQSLGGQVRLVTTGSAPLSPKILMFLRCCMGCPVLEGYGQTECGAICCLQMPGDGTIGDVGPPLRSNYVKLADVPDMNYSASEDKGEICVKGPNVFQGYLKDPEKTKEAIDADGWLHTGDIGEWTPAGCIRIIDRKKHIFKLAQGEYIAPEKIENVYVRSPLVAQVYVHGDSLKSSIVAIVAPDPERVPKYAEEKLNLKGNMSEVCRNEDFKKAVLDSMIDIGKKAGLSSLEQVKDIYLFPDLFSVDNGLLTPTFKAKRADLKKYFSSEIDQMYSKLQ